MTKSLEPSNVFTNSAGQSFTVHGVSPLLSEQISGSLKDEYAKVGKILPPVPTYEVTTISGEKETHEHDETTLKVPDNPEQTAENKRVWAEYKKAYNEFEGEFSARTMRSAFMAVEAVPTEKWRREMAFLGVKLPPKDTPEEKYAFVEYYVVNSPTDIAKLIAMVFHLSGLIGEAAVAEVEATFQSVMERSFTQAGKQISKTERVDSNTILQRSVNGEVLEHEAIEPGLM